MAPMVLLGGCDAVVGSKSDTTTDEVFDAGRAEPGLLSSVEYVPLFPFYSVAGDGLPFDGPTDVYVGFDELLYVTDSRGLHVLDVAGRPAAFVPITGGATSVIQDRRFHVYVTARRDTTLATRVWHLPVVIRYGGITSGAPYVADMIWHPFDDDSRRFNRPDPIDTDEQVSFTGVAVRATNDVYVARRGPVNSVTSIISRHNTVMIFDEDGRNTGTVLALHPTQPSLLSAVNPSDVLTTVHPPQRSSLTDERHFVVAQVPATGSRIPYPVLSILSFVTQDGITFGPDTRKIQVASVGESGDGFLYDEFKFETPSDLAYAADGTNYLFVLDSSLNRLSVFTSAGVEGVAAPPGSGSTRPVVVSFGSEGSGARQFRSPQGVAYFDHIVYVADTGNNRLSRFRLNTDFE